MPVPADIRAVPRPVNTIVDDNGENGPKRYAVRQRGSSKYVSGGNPQPKNGKVIGHIIDHKYVPIPEKNPGTDEPDMLSYGASALVKSVTADLKEDLLAVYDASDVYAMMSLATLRVIKPAITADPRRSHVQEFHRQSASADRNERIQAETILPVADAGNCSRPSHRHRRNAETG